MITRFDNLFYILHYSVAAYLSGRLRLALAVIEAYLTLSPLPSTIDPQFSEVLLYKARILMDLKRDKEAFEFLETVGRVYIFSSYSFYLFHFIVSHHSFFSFVFSFTFLPFRLSLFFFFHLLHLFLTSNYVLIIFSEHSSSPISSNCANVFSSSHDVSN